MLFRTTGTLNGSLRVFTAPSFPEAESFALALKAEGFAAVSIADQRGNVIWPKDDARALDRGSDLLAKAEAAVKRKAT